MEPTPLETDAQRLHRHVALLVRAARGRSQDRHLSIELGIVRTAIIDATARGSASELARLESRLRALHVRIAALPPLPESPGTRRERVLGRIGLLSEAGETD